MRDKLAKMNLKNDYEKELRSLVTELGVRMNKGEERWYSKDITKKECSWYMRHRSKKIEEPPK